MFCSYSYSLNTRTERQVLISTDSVKLQVSEQYCSRALIMSYFRLGASQSKSYVLGS